MAAKVATWPLDVAVAGVSATQNVPVLADVALVVLRRSVRSLDDVEIPAGTVVTIVAVWNEGSAYDVEFATPPGALAMVTRDDVEPVEPAA